MRTHLLNPLQRRSLPTTAIVLLLLVLGQVSPLVASAGITCARQADAWVAQGVGGPGPSGTAAQEAEPDTPEHPAAPDSERGTAPCTGAALASAGAARYLPPERDPTSPAPPFPPASLAAESFFRPPRLS